MATVSLSSSAKLSFIASLSSEYEVYGKFSRFSCCWHVFLTRNDVKVCSFKEIGAFAGISGNPKLQRIKTEKKNGSNISVSYKTEGNGKEEVDVEGNESLYNDGKYPGGSVHSKFLTLENLLEGKVVRIEKKSRNEGGGGGGREVVARDTEISWKGEECTDSKRTDIECTDGSSLVDPWGRTAEEVQNQFRVSKKLGSRNDGQENETLEEIITVGGDTCTWKLAVSLKSKRDMAQSALVEALRSKGLGPLVVQQLVSYLPNYVDKILLEAVMLKRDKVYSDTPFKSRCQVAVAESSIAELIRWLKRAKVSKSKISSLVLLKAEKREALVGHIVWLKKLGMEGNEAATLIKKYPHILDTSVENLQV